MGEENPSIELAKIVADVIKSAPSAVVGKILPVDKLIDTLARGIGLFYHPTHVRSEAAARAESLIAETNAAELAKDIRSRAKFRREIEALRHQINLESIAARAEKYLPGEVSSEPVDQGWSSAFADKAKNATRDSLQELWAKILAGEVSSPGSISKRTLSTIESMSDKDAARFVKVANASIDDDIVPGVESRGIAEIGLATSDLVELADRGLIDANMQAAIIFQSGSQLRYFNEIWTLVNNSGSTVRVPLLLLTDSGKELLRVTDRRPIPHFASVVDSSIRKMDANCSISVSPAAAMK